MAKVKAPLFGLGARGQLGKALVYFPWKGIDCVREYVIPTNPRATLQVAQRNKLTAAVDEFHAAGYSALDLSAWTRYASTKAQVMTGFNVMCKSHIDEAVLGNTWERISAVVISDITATGAVFTIFKESSGNSPYCRYGISKTFMPGTMVFADQTGGEWIATLTFLTANTDYYAFVTCGASGTDLGRTGIYKFRTLAA